MPDVRGLLLPVYVLADESKSMEKHLAQLDDGLSSLHEALLAEPMAAAKVRFSVLGFSADVVERLHLADLREIGELPGLSPRDWTNYEAVFVDLRARIPRDVTELKSQGYRVHRPAVFFLSDGQPNRGGEWKDAHRQLVDRGVTPAAPNVIACGIGDDVAASTILDVATQPTFAFVSVRGADVGASIAQFCGALTRSVVQSARAVGSSTPELVVEKPEGFRMAIDVI
jgi:uncharacterized protein YegL